MSECTYILYLYIGYTHTCCSRQICAIVEPKNCSTLLLRGSQCALAERENGTEWHVAAAAAAAAAAACRCSCRPGIYYATVKH